MNDFKDAVNVDIDTEPAKKKSTTKAQDIYDEHYKDVTADEPAKVKSEDKENA